MNNAQQFRAEHDPEFQDQPFTRGIVGRFTALIRKHGGVIRPDGPLVIDFPDKSVATYNENTDSFDTN